MLTGHRGIEAFGDGPHQAFILNGHEDRRAQEVIAVKAGGDTDLPEDLRRLRRPGCRPPVPQGGRGRARGCRRCAVMA